MKKDFSLAICTYNRAASLRRTLESVAAGVGRSACAWELLVIDNNSNDDTRAAVREFEGRLPLRYLFESRQGLSHARNRALAESVADLLLCIDDDMTLQPAWAEGFLAAAGGFPDADFFGGRILPEWPEGKPGWLHDEDLALVSGVFGKYDLGSSVRPYRPGEPHPYGGNFGLRRRLFERLDGFRADLGVSGTTAGRGEETEYFQRAAGAGSRGVYVGASVCRHRIRAEQTTLRYLYQYGFQTAVAGVRMGMHVGARGGYGAAAAITFRGILQLLRGRGDRFRQCVINAGIRVGLRRAAGRG